MKYCVMSNLRFATPAKRDTLDIAVKALIGGKPVWGETIISIGKDEEGQPNHSLIVRFDNESDMDELYDLIKGKIEKIPVLHGSVSKHNCPHDEGGIPCVISEEYIKE